MDCKSTSFYAVRRCRIIKIKPSNVAVLWINYNDKCINLTRCLDVESIGCISPSSDHKTPSVDDKILSKCPNPHRLYIKPHQLCSNSHHLKIKAYQLSIKTTPILLSVCCLCAFESKNSTK